MLEKVGLLPEDVVYFGDDEDDIPSLRRCGIGVAMANAGAVVKTAADFITDTNDCNGVANWLIKTLITEE